MPRYKTYHGRKKSRWIKTLLIVLLIGILASLCVFVLPNYITFSEDGISIDLPFLAWMVRKPSPTPTPPINSVIVELPSAEPSPSPSPSPSPTPVRKPEQVRAFFIPLTQLGNPDALETLRDRALSDGINMLALEYKDIRGTVVNDAILAQALATLSDPALTLTAVIPACVDNTIPFGSNAAWAVKHSSGVNFKDTNENRWLNLYLPEVRDYIVQLTMSAYEAGFDRVMLTHIGFPYMGGTSQIDYDGEDLTVGSIAAVNALLTNLRDAVGELPLDAWVFEGTANEGVFETAGQDLVSFSETFDRLYVTLPDDVSSVETDLIPVIPMDGADVSHKLELAEQGFLLYSETGIYFAE